MDSTSCTLILVHSYLNISPVYQTRELKLSDHRSYEIREGDIPPWWNDKDLNLTVQGCVPLEIKQSTIFRYIPFGTCCVVLCSDHKHEPHLLLFLTGSRGEAETGSTDHEAVVTSAHMQYRQSQNGAYTLWCYQLLAKLWNWSILWISFPSLRWTYLCHAKKSLHAAMVRNM